MVFAFMVILVSMILILCKVWEMERRIQRYVAMSEANQQCECAKEVGRQALLCIAAFFLTYFPIGGLQLLRGNNARQNFSFALLVKSLSTMQGFFNAIIFLHNQCRALTTQGKSLYFCAIFRPTPDLLHWTPGVLLWNVTLRTQPPSRLSDG